MEVSRKLVIGVAAAVVAAAVVGGGWWYQSGQKDKQTSASTRQTADTTDSPGSLSVGGSATNLGQLDTKQAQGTDGTGGSGSSGGDINPAQFAQYDKHKNEQNALFGEMQTGSGAPLNVGQKASIYYRLWLTNGALVDQSPTTAGGQKQPFSFTLGGHQVILGMEQGVAGMKVGGKRLIVVPPVVGYGSQGQGSIPPNAVLIFEVQLIEAQ